VRRLQQTGAGRRTGGLMHDREFHEASVAYRRAAAPLIYSGGWMLVNLRRLRLLGCSATADLVNS
jgi:hypothetical protein